MLVTAGYLQQLRVKIRLGPLTLDRARVGLHVLYFPPYADRPLRAVIREIGPSFVTVDWKDGGGWMTATTHESWQIVGNYFIEDDYERRRPED